MTLRAATSTSTLRRIASSVLITVVSALLLTTATWPGGAQTNGEIESVREQRRQAEADAKAKAADVNVADAELEEVSSVLVALNAAVNAQEARLGDAQRQLADAEAALIEAEEAVREGEETIGALRDRLAAQAISSFRNQGENATLLAQSDDPNLALRMQVLADEVTQQGVDVADQLKAAEEDLRISATTPSPPPISQLASGSKSRPNWSNSRTVKICKPNSPPQPRAD